MTFNSTSRVDFDFISKYYDYMVNLGIRIDFDIAETIHTHMQTRLIGLDEYLRSEIPSEYDDINWSSPKQVSALLDNYFDFSKYAKKTAKGNTSYDQDTLHKIHEKTGSLFAKSFADYKSLKSIQSKLIEIVNSADPDTGLIYPSFSFGDTNRVSYTSPGISNCHDSIRPIIVPHTGYSLLKIDYKAQEVYIAANMLNIEELKYIYSNYDDFYFGVVKEVTGYDLLPSYRSNVKTSWLAGFYGSALSKIQFVDDTEREICMKIKDYALNIPEVVEFRSYIKNDVLLNRLPIVSYFGSTRDLPDYVFKMYGDHAFNTAFNNTFQLTGSDLLFLALTNFSSLGIDPNLIRPYFTIHDEVIFLVRDDLIDSDLVNDTVNSMILDIEGWTKIRTKISITESY